MKNKKIPLRKCISCKQSKEKIELIRVVKNKKEGIKIDETGKLNGRGAYVCLSKECIDDVIENKLLNNHLKFNVDKEIYEELKSLI